MLIEEENMILLLWAPTVVILSETNTRLYGLIKYFFKKSRNPCWDRALLLKSYLFICIMSCSKCFSAKIDLASSLSLGTFSNVWDIFDCPSVGLGQQCRSTFYSEQDSPPAQRNVPPGSHSSAKAAKPCFKDFAELEMPWNIWRLWVAYP